MLELREKGEAFRASEEEMPDVPPAALAAMEEAVEEMRKQMEEKAVDTFKSLLLEQRE